MSTTVRLNLTGAGSFNLGWNYEGATTYTILNTDDGAASHVYSPTANDIITYALADLPSDAATITSVTVNATTYKLDPVTATTHNVVVVGGTVYESTDLTPTSNTSYETLSYTWNNNPKTGQPWTVAEVNALEIGVKKINSAGERLSYISADVVYAAAAATAPSYTGTASFSGSGSLSTNGATAKASGSAAFSGAGTLSTSGKPAVSGAAAFTGTGTLSTATSQTGASGTATFSGSGALSASASRVAASGSVAFSGIGTLSTNNGAAKASGSTAFSGSGVLTVGATMKPSLPYSESFSGANGSPWSAAWVTKSNNASTIDLSNGQGRMVSPSVAWSGAVKELSSAPVGDTDLVATITFGNGPAWAAIYIDGDGTVGSAIDNGDGGSWYPNNAYVLECGSAGDITLLRNNSGAQVGLSYTHIPFTIGVPTRVRLTRQGLVLSAHIWAADQPETSAAVLTAPLSDTPYVGVPGLIVGADNDPTAVTVLWDDVTASVPSSAYSGTATFSGDGALSTASGVKASSGSKSFSGTGTLTVTPEFLAVAGAHVAFTGGGVLSATGRQTTAAAVQFSGSGRLSVRAIITKNYTPIVGASGSPLGMYIGGRRVNAAFYGAAKIL